MMCKVLVVDDEPDIRMTLDDALREEGFQVAQAANGLEALHILEQEGGWVVLLDLIMPVMDGHTFLETLQHRLSLLATNQIILLSTGGQLDRERQCLHSDIIAAAVAKPFELNRLLLLLRCIAQV